VLSFVLIGIGVGASGTSLLVLLAKRVERRRRAAAATVVWLMMIAGMALTAALAGQALDPFSPARLVAVTATVTGAAFLLTLLAVHKVEGHATKPDRDAAPAAAQGGFCVALAQVWAEPQARRFAIFVFVSMLAYSAQDLILEPFAGLVFDYTPGESTKLAGVQHGGVLAGMILVALAGSAIGGPRLGSMRAWTIGGCIASGLALVAIAAGGFMADWWPLRLSVFALGLANGAFAVAAIGSMMGLAGDGRKRREGVRIGLWGAAQATAFGLGGFAGTVAIDLTRWLFEAPAVAYATVFAAEGMLFLVAAALAARVGQLPPTRSEGPAGALVMGASGRWAWRT
jgi:BCD family chlorophyll transporter-like MFS transporter